MKAIYTEKDFRDAVFQFFLEHSDLSKNGSYFVKFHFKNRKQIENRIFKARMKYGYERIDDRLDMTFQEKKLEADKRRQEFMAKKIAKAKAYNDRKRAYREVQRIAKMKPIRKFIYKLIKKIKHGRNYQKKNG